MKNLFLLLIILTSSLLNAQEHDEAYVDSQVEEFKNDLKDRGISQFIVYKSYCVGENRIITIKKKMCVSKGTFFQSFVVWNEEGVDKVKKFDNCGSFRTLSLDDNSLSEFYLSEWSALMDDEVKPYRSAAYTGKPQLRKTPNACMREVNLVSPSKQVHKKFDLFSLGNESDGKNLNYDFNQTLKLVGFHKKMEAIITDGAFRRE